jgi:hypothetical protein
MAVFKFQAKNAKTGEPIKANVYLGGTDRGFTKASKDDWLVVETSSSGRYEWYAKYFGEKIDSGSSSGGTILILYTPR